MLDINIVNAVVFIIVFLVLSFSGHSFKEQVECQYAFMVRTLSVMQSKSIFHIEIQGNMNEKPVWFAEFSMHSSCSTHRRDISCGCFNTV